jgi:hypothetical protein
MTFLRLPGPASRILRRKKIQLLKTAPCEATTRLVVSSACVTSTAGRMTVRSGMPL